MRQTWLGLSYLKAHSRRSSSNWDTRALWHVQTRSAPSSRLSPPDRSLSFFQRAPTKRGHRLLDYGDPGGHPRLREALASSLRSERHIAVESDKLLVTRGSQMALYLLAQTLFQPGDLIAVEQMRYRPAWDAFRAAGVQLNPIPVDDHGLQIERIAKLSGRLRGVYVTPHHPFPTLDAGRRLQLLDIAARHLFPIIEDDYDNEFHFTGHPVPPWHTP